MRRRQRQDPRRARLRVLGWTTLLGLLFGAVAFGAPLENALRDGRDSLRMHAASGGILLVGIDDRSVRDVDSWPWPRRNHGRVIAELERLGARRIFYDIGFSLRSDPADDKALAAAVASQPGKVTLPVRSVVDPATGLKTDRFPIPALAGHARLAGINVFYDRQGIVRKMPYALSYGGRSFPSLAAALTGRTGPAGASFPIDYSIDPRTVPVLSAADLLAGKVPARAVGGRDVIVGTTSMQLGDVYFVPGQGRMPGVYLHILAAETLKAGRPLDLGWLIPFLATLALALLAASLVRLRDSCAMLGASIAALLAVPLGLEAEAIHADIVPSLFLLLVAGSWWGWSELRRASRLGAETNPVTGLPNLNALRRSNSEAAALVVARVLNYAEICSALPAGEEPRLIDQIVRRLAIGAGDAVIHQGDDGVFAWLESSDESGGLDSLHALFRAPVAVAGSHVDLAISFGVDGDPGRSLANRLASAQVAAEEAAAEGRRWKRYDPAKLKEAQWKLSMLSQLDAAIAGGGLWVAYQPKLDLKTGRMIGAEALARWTHPEKGEIGPVDFIPAAEQSGRIENLTEYVLGQAVKAAAAMNRRGRRFEMSVNLSARLIESFDLLARVEALLDHHRLSADLLTLEVTETAALATGTGSMAALLRLRALGVQISIDDYGTGLSTLEYLKKIPATEIKVDQSFVQSIHRSQSDRLMVHSTIQLAHSLGHKVVAEGVEDRQTLETLALMGCDSAQGYYIARPMPFRALVRTIFGQPGKREAA